MVYRQIIVLLAKNCSRKLIFKTLFRSRNACYDSFLKIVFELQGISMRQLRGRYQCDPDGDWLPTARGSRGRPAAAAGFGQALLWRRAASGHRG
jgi:hypothetical protein